MKFISLQLTFYDETVTFQNCIKLRTTTFPAPRTTFNQFHLPTSSRFRAVLSSQTSTINRVHWKHTAFAKLSSKAVLLKTNQMQQSFMHALKLRFVGYGEDDDGRSNFLSYQIRKMFRHEHSSKCCQDALCLNQLLYLLTSESSRKRKCKRNNCFFVKRFC